MTTFDQSAFHAWLRANSPSNGPLSLTDEPVLLAQQALTLLAAYPDRPVVANGILSGCGAQSALRLDADYVHARPGNDAVAALQRSPVTGCSMLLTLAREKSGYDPSVPAQAGSLAMFFNYVNQILKCPLFSQVLNDHIAPTFSGDWNNTINQIIGYYVGIPDYDLSALRQSLVNVAAAASSNPSTNQTLNVFSQSTINVNADTRVYLYSTNVQMVTTVTSGGKHEPDRVSNQANLSLYRVQMRFDAAQWPAQAAAVYGETQQSLADWLAFGSTPSGSLPSDWHPR
ncbi:hypothetical protein [Azospirillum sp. TSO22-1]|uniref:hypothetical protein n=1 Tax=Azospirillum sp. TSO22-1 TaxID=716789 RepID=UPI000D604A39|nr:hypothetical protein [Azospirillum sp. TSO22-1]PWC40157.1 hypothetical protein TSO221_25610 [Azospirillum sp. TSO22-1]